MLESFLIKIASLVFKKAAIGGVLASAAAAYEIYSVIDTISDVTNSVDTVNDCSELAVYGVEVATNRLTDEAFDKIVKFNNHSFSVNKTKSGIYIASSMLPKFEANNLVFPQLSNKSFSKISNKNLKKPKW